MTWGHVMFNFDLLSGMEMGRGEMGSGRALVGIVV